MLERALVRRVGEPEADASFDLENLAAEIDDAIELVGLIGARVKPAQRSIVRVLLYGDGPHRRNVVGDARVRREIQIPDAVVSGIEDRIDDDVDRPHVPADDRPYLRRKAPRVPT